MAGRPAKGKPKTKPKAKAKPKPKPRTKSAMAERLRRIEERLAKAKAKARERAEKLREKERLAKRKLAKVREENRKREAKLREERRAAKEKAREQQAKAREREKAKLARARARAKKTKAELDTRKAKRREQRLRLKARKEAEKAERERREAGIVERPQPGASTQREAHDAIRNALEAASRNFPDHLSRVDVFSGAYGGVDGQLLVMVSEQQPLESARQRLMDSAVELAMGERFWIHLRVFFHGQVPAEVYRRLLGMQFISTKWVRATDPGRIFEQGFVVTDVIIQNLASKFAVDINYLAAWIQWNPGDHKPTGEDGVGVEDAEFEQKLGSQLGKLSLDGEDFTEEENDGE